MNETTPPQVSGASLTAFPSAKINAGMPSYLPRLMLGLAMAVAMFDMCFWGISAWGFSVAVFFIVLALIILANRESLRIRPMTLLLLVLLGGAALAAAIETGINNTLVFLILIIALAGDIFFDNIESPWGRMLSQCVAMVRAPGRVFWLGGVLLEATLSEGLGWTGGLIGGCLLAIPALVLALIFGLLLMSGNAVFGSWISSFFSWFWNEFALYLDPVRIFLWFFVAFLILPLLRPVNVSPFWWSWIERLPRVPEFLPSRAALFSSALVLVVLNFLFLIANSADVFFLWGNWTLPAGVTYKDYVHQGVNSLTVTVILSALVLVTIFQQALPVTQRRELRFIAYVWIAQNFFLLFSVAERLRRYIVASELTVARLGVMIFLVLVFVGYLLLTIKIVKEKSISWLIGGCALAVFVTFYTTQFLDLAGWAANYNVARFQEKRTYGFDARTMSQWGPPVWPALRRAHEIDPADPYITQAWEEAKRGSDYSDRCGLDWQHWREFSIRAWMNRSTLEEKN